MENLNELKIQQEYINKSKILYNTLSEKVGHPLTCCVNTFGCQMNARDSEKLLGILVEVGFKDTDNEEADFVIYNTCTVRDNANQRVYGRLGYLHNLKKKNPYKIIALCGCMMQEESVLDTIRTKYSFVNLVFGTHNIFKFAELLFNTLSNAINDNNKMLIDIWKDTDQIVESLPIKRKYKFKSGINIMFGCNNFCSYCIVPYVRGRERSRSSSEIIEEIKNLVADGVVEVLLLGQNVNSYGKNLDEDITFAQLLMKIEQIEGIERIRFMTSHPKDLSDELIEVMKNSKKICRHLHLPAQSGSNRILKAMNRRYTREDYLALVDKLKKAIPDLSLTTDLIIGFPGETMEDMKETASLVEEVGFDNAFTFIYSKRTGTPAAAMENQVDEELVAEGFNMVLETVQKTARSRVAKWEGTVQTVLVEEVNSHDSSFVTGRMSNNLLVHFEGTEELIGTLVDVELTENKGFYYIGKMKNES